MPNSPSPVERTRLFAHIDIAVNLLALGAQLAVTNRLLRAGGLASGLLLLPALSVLGFGWLAAAPGLGAVVVFVVARRVAEYAVARPSREALFTVLERESKYKAKNFIDTAFTRGSEAMRGWAVNAARALGAGDAALSLAAIPLAALWSALALYLARRCAALAPLEAPRPRDRAGSPAV